MELSSRSREELSHEWVPPSKMIERRWSAPTSPTEWQDINPRWSDVTFKIHSTCSDTEVDETNKAYEELRVLTEHGPEPVQDNPHCFMKCSHDACEAFIQSHMNAAIVREHKCNECNNSAPRMTVGNTSEASVPAPTPVDDFRLQLYALEIRSMTQRAMDNLVTSGGTEPFPAYHEVDYIEGIDPYASEPESAAVALQASIEGLDRPFRPRSNRPMPSDNGGAIPYPFPRSFSIDEQSIAGNVSSSNASPFNSRNSTRPSTRPSLTDFGATDKSMADLSSDRRVRRKEGCYFSTSENQRDSNGEHLITKAS